MGWAAIGSVLVGVGVTAGISLGLWGADSHLWSDDYFLAGFAGALLFTLLGFYVLWAEFIGGIGPIKFPLPLTRRERETRRPLTRPPQAGLQQQSAQEPTPSKRSAPQGVERSVGDESVVIGTGVPDRVGDRSVVIGATDDRGNTIIRGGTAVGYNARADSTSIAIGTHAGAGGDVVAQLRQQPSGQSASAEQGQRQLPLDHAIERGEELARLTLQAELQYSDKSHTAESQRNLYNFVAGVRAWGSAINAEEAPKFSGDPNADLSRLRAFVARELARLRAEREQR